MIIAPSTRAPFLKVWQIYPLDMFIRTLESMAAAQTMIQLP